MDPKQLLKISKNDERQQNKVEVVTKLLNALRGDQSGISKDPLNKPGHNAKGLIGRIHGCVGSHWELLPPVYAESSDINACYASAAREDARVTVEVNSAVKHDDESPVRKNPEISSSWLFPHNTTTSDESSSPCHSLSTTADNEEATYTTSRTEENESSNQKVYPVIRGGGLRLPGLDLSKTFRKGYSVLVWVRPTLNCAQISIPDGAAIRKQVLYRFATSLHDNVVGAVGVCAILGQWQAVSLGSSEGCSDSTRTLLTTTVTAYTLPNADPMSHLYPNKKITKEATSLNDNGNGFEDESAHTLNIKHFQRHQSVSLKDKEPGKLPSMGSDKSSFGDENTAPSLSSIGGYVTAQLTLPADEWSLIGIQHTHPYLRRPELSISVNGEEIVKGELRYPVLDGVVGDEEIVGEISAMKLSGSSSTSPKTTNDELPLGASGAAVLSDSERKMLKRQGVLAECTLLDGAFENGVLAYTKEQGDLGGNRHKTCVLSVHSLAVLSGVVPNVVLAMIAERGPMGDSASGNGLSFLLGPVPTNPQNRDAVVALSAGYGYYGSGGSSRGGSPGVGISGGSGHVQDKYLSPPRSLGLPVSIGITPGVTMSKGSGSSREGSVHGATDLHGTETWIGGSVEHNAHVCLQGLIGRAILTFHAGDTVTLGHVAGNVLISTTQARIICKPSAAPSYIGGVDEVPKVGIIRPTTNPVPISSSARLEITGNALYHNLTLSYIRKENSREQGKRITPSVDISNTDNHPPVSFTRAIHAANVVNLALLPFRLALPRTGTDLVNSAQCTLHSESFIHLSDILSNEAQLAGLLIEFLNECILCGGSTLRDDALQNGTIHALVSLLRRVLIRGGRLGLLKKEENANRFATKSTSCENIDYDQDHDSSCPHVFPIAVRKALVQLIDACCGPLSLDLGSLSAQQSSILDPHRGLLRVRRTSDLALTALFGLALDFDFLGKDFVTAASLIEAIAQRYCQVSTYSFDSQGISLEEPVYGSILRSQMNLQYFLDTITIRFDNTVSMHSRPSDRYSDRDQKSLQSMANSLSDILYSMALSTLTSASGSAVTRGERDIGALISALTECQFGTVCANVVTTAIAKLLVKCGVFSPLCLEKSSFLFKSSALNRNTVDTALENRLARSMLLCHYHDIVAPLILSRSAPNYSSENIHPKEDSKDSDNTQASISCDVGVVSKKCLPLDWTYDWRLTLLTYLWLSSLAGSDERLPTSQAAGRLIFAAAETGSLDNALIGHDCRENGGQTLVVIQVLTQFLVLRSSGEKDTAGTINKAEIMSRRLSVFTQLIPGVTRLLLSPSIQRNDDQVHSYEAFIVNNETACAAAALKEILSLLSLSIQSLYGSKKGGLLTSKPGSNEVLQRNRAKALFISAAEEYAPILLQVVSLLEKPVVACRLQDSANITANVTQYTGSEQSKESSPESLSTDTVSVQRERTDSTDKDWVDVHHSPKIEPAAGELPSNVTLSPLTSPLKASGPKTSKESPDPRRQCYNDFVSCQDIALYAVSRLVAQAMKYGGGEASTSVWRVIISTLSNSDDTTSRAEGKAALSCKPDGVSAEKDPSATNLVGALSSKKILCHLVALVLSKFARYHDKGSHPVRSQWNPETCSAVARLMDLIEEKRLLSDADQFKEKGSRTTPKYSIDQVRLLKSLLEVMSSGRESSGWSQLESSNYQRIDERKSDPFGNAVEKASTHSNYQLYNQQTLRQGTPTKQSPAPPPNPKLLLPILQSCLRLVLPSVGIIRSEAVVISAGSTGKTPSTAILLELVVNELNKSITAAISGLTFSVSRDIFMNAIFCLQKSLEYHKNFNDAKAIKILSEMLLSIIEAMRRRYVDERNRKEKSSNDSYDDGERSVGGQGEQQETAVVERLILGNDLIPKSEHSDVDFLAYPGDPNDNLKTTPNMGYSEYKGLGAALNRCYRELNQNPSLGTRCLGISSGFKAPEEKAQLALSILDPFIENWNKAQAHDAAEQELVDLFDESQSGPFKTSSQVTRISYTDAVTRFAEARFMLKQQHSNLAFEYLVSRRFGRTAFTERLCWKTWMEFADVELSNALWERAIYDGGRDYYSKMATMPLFPQFPRFIPSYLDHSPSSLSVSTPSPEIDLIGQGIAIVDITKKENVEEEMQQLFESNDDGAVEDAPGDYHEEDLDVLFPNKHNDSQMSSSANFASIGDGSEHSEDSKEQERQANENNLNRKDASPNTVLEHGSFHFAASSFSFPPDSSSLLSLGEGVRLAGGMLEEYYSSCLHVKPDCSRKCTVMLTENHLILEFEDGDGVLEGENESHHKKMRQSLADDKAEGHDQKALIENALRPKAMRWNISEASHIYLRRYRLRDSALEIFFIPSAGATTGGVAFFAGSRSLFIDFGAGAWGNTRRDDAANALMRRAPMQTVKQWPEKSGQFLHDELKKLTQAWSQGAITNFDYLSSLNCLSGRSYNDICQYPVFPWTLCNFTSETVPDLTDKANYRDLSKPIGALNEVRLAELIERFETFADPSIPPFIQLQSGHFDVADRLFSSVQRTWEMCTGRSAAEVKELTPEFYCNPAFLRNSNNLKLGTMQEGELVGDVALPPWANGSPEKFVEVMRMALESDVCSEMLGSWIDLIFGYKQQGKQAIEAHNVDVASIEDEALRLATECQIAHFGQCPMQLFYRPHIRKRERVNRRSRQTLSETLGLYDVSQMPSCQVGPRKTTRLPFMDSPMSHWVHLAAPPPGPHAPLISIRLTVSDRCLAVDSRGIYHFFRWAWKPEVADDDVSDSEEKDSDKGMSIDMHRDKGCFVAQRELMSFRNIPCLPYAPKSNDRPRDVTVCMSKTLFSNRTLLLVLSDGDGRGGLAMQLVDPVKGTIKGEVIVPSAHADYITSIDMDPIGTAAGQGGVGGELAVVGSADGSLTLWRFISSHYWPLRPRLRMMGHSGSKVYGVAISSVLGICASISSHRCCLFDVGNGAMIRVFAPPSAACADHLGKNLLDESAIRVTTFADTPALCLSILGYVAVICSTKLIREDQTLDEVFSIELMTLEGIHVGSKLLEPDRGLPKKMFSSVDGRALFVCAGRGVSICLVSSLQPLSFVDEWRLTEDDGDEYNTRTHQAIYDLDFGPTFSRPVVVAAGCSEGALRLHALQGISKWSLENQRNVVSSAVGSVLALPAQTVKNAIGGVAGFGSRFVGLGKEIGKEAFTAVKERDTSFGFFRKK
ncbi:hypothetical protein HJC23_000373 [Cyclotella cryptica]|uniref:HECT-type E3 ubiquitin transferase n=1 Tax=Cyclotella cryptica TaxID=29204 RepID=A0ABD3P7J9_9STRA